MATTLAPSWRVLLPTTAVAAMVGGIVASAVRDRFGVALPLSAVCSLAVLWTTAWRTQAVLPANPDRAFAVALGASGASVFVTAWLWILHGAPIWVEALGDLVECGGPIPLGPVAAVAALPWGIALAETFASELPRLHPYLARVVVAALAIAIAALSVVGLRRSVSHPTPGDHFARLPIVATLRAPSAAGLVETHPVGPMTLTVGCPPSEESVRCYVFLRRGSQGTLPANWPLRREMQSDVRNLTSVERGATLQVLRHARRDLWIVQTPELHGSPRAIAAFRGAGLERVDLSLRDFPGDYAPPSGWPIAALLGVALAAWWMRRARLVAPPPAGPLADATLGNDGTLHLSGGTVLTTPPIVAAVFPAGPVVIAAPTTGSAYRDGGTATVVRAGTLAGWEALVRDERDVRHALAFSTLVLLGTPMVFAAFVRLLW